MIQQNPVEAIALERLKQDEAGLTRALLAAYILSNHRFPQTRFYFVIDFCSRLSPEEFRRVRTSCLIIPPDMLQRLAEFGTVEHAQRRIVKKILPHHIDADIKKMMQAVSDVFSAYSETHASPRTCEPQFLIGLRAMKTKVDQLGVSEGYLDFISSPNGGGSATVVRSDNTYLRRQLVAALGSSALTRALEPQVVRPVWVRR